MKKETVKKTTISITQKDLDKVHEIKRKWKFKTLDDTLKALIKISNKFKPELMVMAK